MNMLITENNILATGKWMSWYQ